MLLTFYNAQDSLPQQQINWPKIPRVLRLRNPAKDDTLEETVSSFLLKNLDETHRTAEPS